MKHKTSDLGKAAARGSVVTLAGQGTRILLQVVSVSVLARLLTPVDYGLVAMVLTIVAIGEILRDVGLSTAAIQAESLSDHQRNNLFWLNSAIGLTLTIVVFAAAPLVAGFYHQPRLVDITRALSLTFLVNGMAAQFRASLNRGMKFVSLVAADVTAQVIGLGIGIVLATRGGGVWSLVAQQLTVTVVGLLVLVAAGRWFPGAPRRDADVRSFVRFGWYLMLTQVIGYVNNNVDTVTVGLRFGANTLGVYNRAYQLLVTPLNQVRTPTTTVALPVLSRLQQDHKRAGRYLVTGQLALGYTLVPALAFAGGAAVPLVDILLGHRWAQSAPLFSLLAVSGMFTTVSYVGYWVYVSRGLTQQLMRYSVVSLVIKVACVVVGSSWGVMGVAAGFAIAPGIAWPVSLLWLAHLTAIPVRELWLGALRILGCALIAGCASWLASHLTVGEPAILRALASLGAAATAYAVACGIRWVRQDLHQVIGIAGKVLKR